MKRNMPEVLNNTQKQVIFLPETHLPKVPRVVDLQAYEPKKKSLGVEDLAVLGMKKGTEDITNARGDIAEKLLAEELQKYFSNRIVVVIQGGSFRAPGKGKGAIQEHDFVIVDMEQKVIICLESKVTLTGSTGNKAIEQTKRCQKLLEEYFASELTANQWCFAGVIFTQEINLKHDQEICPDCSPFIIRGAGEVTTKLKGLEAKIRKMRTHQITESHSEYVSLVEGLSFVALSHPVSTYCTIATDIYDKVVGKPAVGKTKNKAGQGDFQSIIFWSMEQANIMLTELQFVFFASPWATGKTICMREKAVMWATKHPNEKLFFVVIRYHLTKQTSLLEMELKSFFNEQHNLENVEVLGLPAKPEDTLRCLLQESRIRPHGSWMVDELIVPGDKDKTEMQKLHQQFSRDMEDLHNHINAQSQEALLWIACAGINHGMPEHFERS